MVLNERAPREETLSTLLAEVENIVNSRPLSHVSVDPTSLETLTPNHFLIGSKSCLPIIGLFENSDFCLRKQWRISQRLADMYWRRWVKEILPELLPCPKWQQEKRNLQVGDLVLVVDPDSPRGLWISRRNVHRRRWSSKKGKGEDKVWYLRQVCYTRRSYTY